LRQLKKDLGAKIENFVEISEIRVSKNTVPIFLKKALAKVFESDSLSTPFGPKVGGQHVSRPITEFHFGNRIDGRPTSKLLIKTFYYAS
jgi:hypothetical protein